MGALKIVFGIILIVAALALIAVVLLQSGKDKSLSSAIAGGGKSMDSYYGKNTAKAADKILEKVTAIVAVLFTLIVLVSFIVQKDSDIEAIKDQSTSEAVSETVAETAAAPETEAGSGTAAAEVTDGSAGTTQAAE